MTPEAKKKKNQKKKLRQKQKKALGKPASDVSDQGSGLDLNAINATDEQEVSIAESEPVTISDKQHEDKLSEFYGAVHQEEKAAAETQLGPEDEYARFDQCSPEAPFLKHLPEEEHQNQKHQTAEVKSAEKYLELNYSSQTEHDDEQFRQERTMQMGHQSQKECEFQQEEVLKENASAENGLSSNSVNTTHTSSIPIIDHAENLEETEHRDTERGLKTAHRASICVSLEGREELKSGDMVPREANCEQPEASQEDLTASKIAEANANEQTEFTKEHSSELEELVEGTVSSPSDQPSTEPLQLGHINVVQENTFPDVQNDSILDISLESNHAARGQNFSTDMLKHTSDKCSDSEDLTGEEGANANSFKGSKAAATQPSHAEGPSLTGEFDQKIKKYPSQAEPNSNHSLEVVKREPSSSGNNDNAALMNFQHDASLHAKPELSSRDEEKVNAVAHGHLDDITDASQKKLNVGERDTSPVGKDLTPTEHNLSSKPASLEDGLMEPPESTESVEKTQPGPLVQTLFSYDDNNDEKMPWETEYEQPEDHSRKTAASLFSNEDGDACEKMPWESSASGTDDQVEDPEEKPKSTGNSINGLPSQEGLKTTVEATEQNKVPWEISNSISPDADDDRVMDLQEEEHNIASSDNNDTFLGSLGEKDLIIDQQKDATVNTPTHNVAEKTPNDQSSSSTFAQMFAQSSTNTDEELPWDNNPIKKDSLTETKIQESAQKSLNSAPKKFSFLEEDDDILDDDISEPDSFLESDEDVIPSSTVGTTEGYNRTSPTQNVLSISSDSSFMQSNIPNVAERPSPVSSHGRVSRYEPLNTPLSGSLPPMHNQGDYGENHLQNASQNVSVGIVPPQPFQPQIAIQTVETAVKQEVFQKFNEAKKKSDAYDFPMDLVPKKNKPVHAKPVGVPSHINSVSSFDFGPSNASKKSTPLIDRKVSNGHPNIAPVPLNPYANKSSGHEIPMHNTELPPQGISMSQFNLPASNRVRAPANDNKGSFTGYHPTAMRSRGVSNVSATSGSSTGGSGQTATIPFPQHGAMDESQASSMNWKKTASKYSPSNSVNMNKAYNPMRRLSGNSTIPTMPTAMGNITNRTQDDPQPPLNLHVPMKGTSSSVLSPTSGSSTRRYHARSNSSVYAPNQNEHTSKYAPTVHPQYQNAPPQQTYLLHKTEPANSNAIVQPPPSNWYPNVSRNTSVSTPDPTIDNQALLHKQFPIFSWCAADKLVYGLPSESSQVSYITGSSSTLQDIKVVSTETVLPRYPLLRSFPGPLLKNKTKNKDINKWLENAFKELPVDDSSLLRTIVDFLRIKTSDSSTWRDISNSLYNSDELLVYLSQPFAESQQRPNAHKLDGNSQMKVLAYLQTGGQNEALEVALQNNDYAMALLIGSLMGKERWSEVVQRYLNDEVRIESDISHFSTYLLSLIFQVSVGNSKKAIRDFAVDPLKRQWALDNWKMIISAVLNNINFGTEISSSSINEAPPVLIEFLVEFGLFLREFDYIAHASILFMIAKLPLSSIPLGNTSIKFQCIGDPGSIEGRILSEVYEFACSDDAKGFQCLLPQKLQQAFCYQELGMSAIAARYADHIGTLMKSMPKKDPSVLWLAHSLAELSTRITGSATGWLGKPKLSSVWGQLDKSFNKYIGGDDDDTTTSKKPAENKVFDGFTPVASRNSSMVDVSQHQFTPFQNSAHQSLYGNKDTTSIKKHPQSPVNNVALLKPTLSSQMPLNHTLIESPSQYMPVKATQSLQGSPRKSVYTPTQSAPPENFQPELRRVQTEQFDDRVSGGIHNGSSALRIYRSEEAQPEAERPTGHPNPTPFELLPTALPLKSEHYNSTPNLPRRERSSISDIIPPPKIKSTSRQVSPNLQRVAPVRSSRIPSALLKSTSPKSVTEIAKNQKTNPDSFFNTELSYGASREDDSSKLENTLNEANGHIVASGFSGEVHPPGVLQEAVNEDCDMADEHEDTTVLHTDLYNQEIQEGTWSQSVPEIYPDIRGNPSVADQLVTDEPVADDNYNASVARTNVDSGAPFGTNEMSKPAFPKAKTLVQRESDYGITSLDNKPRNPYAPKQNVTNAFQDRALNQESQENIDNQIENVNNAKSIMAEEHGIPASTAESHAKDLSRFDPIKPPDLLSAETFVPVIKKPAERLFTPRVQSPEIQYDDVIEDESDDEEEEIEERKRKEEERKRKEDEEKIKMEEQARVQKKEKERLQKVEAKEQSDENGQANGWFSWLKKDASDKKPIKAKLGHKKSTFHYDEKLKRWVNKNSSEEEKERLESPPPPPPVVKRMDNGPKTKPQSGRELSSVRESLGPVLPKNPLTGQQMLSSSSPLSQPLPLSAISDTVRPLSPSNVNLSGKKANGLDDLLTLTGSNTAGKRKKRGGRGYVNVMENK